MTSRCGVCGYRVAVYRCRRCGRPVCGECIKSHGLCIECFDYLMGVRRSALRGKG